MNREVARDDCIYFSTDYTYSSYIRLRRDKKEALLGKRGGTELSSWEKDQIECLYIAFTALNLVG
jgi:hypothetical protein